MSAKDKAVIDSLSTTYATKEELKGYLRCVKFGNDYNLVNGNGDVIYTIVGKKDPQLTITPSTSVATGREARAEAAISHFGSGILSIASKESSIDENSYYIEIYNGKIFMSGYGGLTSNGDATIYVTVALSETDEYASATTVWTITGLKDIESVF